MGGTVEELAAWRNSAAQPHPEAMRRKAEADLIPHLVRLAAAAVEEAKKAAEAAGTLSSLAEAAALQAAHGASSMSVVNEQTTPTEKPASLSSLYQATQALQEQAVSRQPAGTLAKLARAESHEGKEAAPLARGAMRPEHRQVLAAAAEAVARAASIWRPPIRRLPRARRAPWPKP